VQEFDQKWQKLSEEVLVGMKDWRMQHPKATFQEIEEALDERAFASASQDVGRCRPSQRSE
jgi:hypothetical protein